MSESSWLKMLDVAEFTAALLVRVEIGSLHPNPINQGGLLQFLFWTLVL